MAGWGLFSMSVSGCTGTSSFDFAARLVSLAFGGDVGDVAALRGCPLFRTTVQIEIVARTARSSTPPTMRITERRLSPKINPSSLVSGLGSVGSVGSTTGSTGSTIGSTIGSITGSVGSTIGSSGSTTGSVGSTTGSTGSTGSTTGSTGSDGSTMGSVGSSTGSTTGSTTGSSGSGSMCAS